MFPDQYSAPFYIFRSREECPGCGASARVVALVAGDDEPLVLTDITSMPEAFVLMMQAVAPEYGKVKAEFGEREVYRNRCGCGEIFADFYLYCEPDGAFFPNSEEEAGEIDVIALPIDGEHRIQCSPGMGTGEIVLECGRRLAWGEFGGA